MENALKRQKVLTLESGAYDLTLLALISVFDPFQHAEYWSSDIKEWIEMQDQISAPREALQQRYAWIKKTRDELDTDMIQALTVCEFMEFEAQNYCRHGMNVPTFALPTSILSTSSSSSSSEDQHRQQYQLLLKSNANMRRDLTNLWKKEREKCDFLQEELRKHKSSRQMKLFLEKLNSRFNGEEGNVTG